ncbi:Na/Pi cotransporter family protein [Clostridium paraputrificum]|uniref:Sodium-dependent phosphate transporter n=3 Tax=Clostridia TaxID=186801 RepID=A0A174FL89_9CLOT|nr:sodium-dependent phosphate transporter [Clostridium paraputrificum]RKI47476.1 Na/Pi cotransporter family protein [Clostridium paraputrificum]CUO50481.1 Na/Pi-cotransporter family protein/PhoU family protein [Clostridium paraputrificum]CUQ47515.1 Na/Pi-cotransporter family protein/PhoU family protein [Clostridium paraputrificum]SQB90195.1 Na/Pi-cotransporter family protein/PhoU family protein [Clostridium paraputrificum]
MESTIMIIMKLMGGLGLFIYGMKLMGDGLENAAGDGLKKILEKVTSNPIKAVLVGAIVTAVIQSSSATTVMVVGFVNAGLMNLTQATGIIMGANIGTTITAQLVSFKLDQIAPLFVFLGTIMVMFARGKKRKDIGNIVLGFGILFTGMGIMSGAMKPLTSSPVFEQLIVTIGDNWLIGVIAGATITAILQSSSATTGILVALATAGAINIQVALPIIFGCNIGTCITAIIASIGANKTAHKAAAIHLIFNIVGTIIFLPFLGLLGVAVTKMSPDVSRQIANAHTVFNIVNTMLLLPFSKYLIVIVNKIIPGEDEEEKAGPKYIDDRLLETPVIAAGQVIKETIRMANKAKKNLELSMDAFSNQDEKLVEKVYENEKIINILEESITTYLVKLAKCEMSDREKDIVASTFHVINDIERIGDHAENVADLASQRINRDLSYSSDAMEELYEIYNYTVNALEISIESYANRDVEKARSIRAIESRINSSQKKFRDKHIKRLYDGKCNAYAGAIFLDLISNFERIGDHSTNIAESVIENYSA